MKKSIVILHLTHWDQLLGGAEQQLKYLTEFMRDSGIDVHVIFPNRNSNVTSANGLHLHNLGKNLLSGKFGKSWFLFYPKIQHRLKKINPDVIITRTYSSFAGIAAQYARLHNKKHIHFIASDSELDVFHQKIPILKITGKIERHFFKKIFSGHSQLICQNQHQQKQIKDLFNIDAQRNTQIAAEPENNSFKKPDDKIIVTWIANLKPVKRPEHFFTIAQAFADNPNISFIMIGPDHRNTYEAPLAKMKNQSNFSYLGKLSNEKVNEILESAHILINTSDHEGFSNTFIQAWMREVLVISLNSNPDNILTNQKVGFLINSVDQIIEKLKFLMQNKDQISLLGKNAREYSLRNHSLKSSLLTIRDSF